MGHDMGHGTKRRRGSPRLLAAGLFATVLALGAVPPAVAQEEPSAGSTWGGSPVKSHDDIEQSFVATAGSLDGMAEPADRTFFYFETDDFEARLSSEGVAVELTASQWGCILDVIIAEEADHFFSAEPYDPGASQLEIVTSDTGDCLEESGGDNGDDDGGDDDGGGGDDDGGTSDDGSEDNTQVEGSSFQQPDRIDTGAGGAATGGGAPLLLALALPAGAVATRRLLAR